ncbi:MAG: glycosyltransferase family 2 protein [Rhodospirillales bacterium]|nr:glycosyltransferase family 2 protein [Rhodospirillales bacterium]
MTKPPKVSIGLPVYNGEHYLQDAVRSILCQTFGDFELIISDNASSDRTEHLCRDLAARDARVRYHRNDRNIGAAANYNRCVELAQGTYFKWSAHDDLIAPSYLDRCVEVLDAHPDVVLCHSLVELIDEHGRHLADYDPAGLGTAAARPSDRLAGRLRTSWCKEVFGLIRADPLRQSVLIGNYVGSDMTLLAELALRGRFVMVPQALALNRDHGRRSTRAHPYSRQRREWFGPPGDRRTAFFQWRHHALLVGLIRRWIDDPRERWRCYAQLLRWLILRGRAAPLLLEPLFVLAPGTFESFERLKAALGRGRRRHLRLRARSNGPPRDRPRATPRAPRLADRLES